jgi:hypothetical protein
MFHLGSDGFLKDQAVTLTDMLLQELEGPKWTGKLKIFETLSELVIAYATKLSQSNTATSHPQSILQASFNKIMNT